MKNCIAGVILAVLSVPLVATAGPNYTYLQAGYVKLDSGPNGFGLGGSYAFNENFYFTGGYSRFSESPLTVSQYTVGVGYNYALTDATDFVVEGGFARGRASVTNLGSISDNGYFLLIGIRGMVTDQFELGGFISRADLDTFGSSTAFSLVALYHFTDSVAIGLSVNDDIDYTLGLRFGF